MTPERILGSDLMPIYERVASGARLTREDGLALYASPNLTGVGYLANIVRERLHGARTYYVRNQHINYTNICNKFCKFCSFYAKKGGPEPYEMSLDDVYRALAIKIIFLAVVFLVVPIIFYRLFQLADAQQTELLRTTVEEKGTLVAAALKPRLESFDQEPQESLQHALDALEVKQRIAQLSGEIQRATPDQAQAFIEQQMSLWGRVIKERKIAVE